MASSWRQQDPMGTCARLELPARYGSTIGVLVQLGCLSRTRRTCLPRETRPGPVPPLGKRRASLPVASDLLSIVGKQFRPFSLPPTSLPVTLKPSSNRMRIDSLPRQSDFSAGPLYPDGTTSYLARPHGASCRRLLSTGGHAADAIAWIRQTAVRASLSKRYDRSPFEVLIRVRSCYCPPGRRQMRATFLPMLPLMLYRLFSSCFVRARCRNACPCATPGAPRPRPATNRAFSPALPALRNGNTQSGDRRCRPMRVPTRPRRTDQTGTGPMASKSAPGSGPVTWRSRPPHAELPSSPSSAGCRVPPVPVLHPRAA